MRILSEENICIGSMNSNSSNNGNKRTITNGAILVENFPGRHGIAVRAFFANAITLRTLNRSELVLKV